VSKCDLTRTYCTTRRDGRNFIILKILTNFKCFKMLFNAHILYNKEGWKKLYYS